MSLERLTNTEPERAEKSSSETPEFAGYAADTVDLVVTTEGDTVFYERNLLIIDTDGEEKMTRVCFAATLGETAIDPDIASFLETHLV